VSQFTYTVSLPSENRVEEIKELHFHVYKHLVKCITNDNNQIIANFFNNILNSLCSNKFNTIAYSFLDKIILLLTIRAVCIAPDLELTVTCPETKSTFKYTASISDIIDKLQTLNLKDDIFKYVKTYDNGLSITLGMPNTLITPTEDDLLKTLIKRIHIRNKEIVCTNQIIDQLPINVLNDINNYLLDFNKQLEDIYILDIRSPFGSQKPIIKIPLNIFTGSTIEFLKLCFKRDLLSVYELEYSLIHKLNMSYSLVKYSTPAELLTYINLYRDEKKEEKNAQNAQQPLNLGHP